MRNFSSAAARQENDYGLTPIQAQGRCKLLARSACSDVSYQRMADKVRPHAAQSGLRALVRMERCKDCGRTVDAPGFARHGRQAQEYQAYKVDVLDALAFSSARARRR